MRHTFQWAKYEAFHPYQNDVDAVPDFNDGYDLRRIKNVRIQIFQGGDDGLATYSNVKKAKSILEKRNKVKFHEIPGYCHFSLAAQADVDITIYPKMAKFFK